MINECCNERRNIQDRYLKKGLVDFFKFMILALKYVDATCVAMLDQLQTPPCNPLHIPSPS